LISNRFSRFAFRVAFDSLPLASTLFATTLERSPLLEGRVANGHEHATEKLNEFRDLAAATPPLQIVVKRSRGAQQYDRAYGICLTARGYYSKASSEAADESS